MITLDCLWGSRPKIRRLLEYVCFSMPFRDWMDCKSHALPVATHSKPI